MFSEIFSHIWNEVCFKQWKNPLFGWKYGINLKKKFLIQVIGHTSPRYFTKKNI